MRTKGEGCDVMIGDRDIVMHTLVASYSEHLLQMCEDIKEDNHVNKDELAKDEDIKATEVETADEIEQDKANKDPTNKEVELFAEANKEVEINQNLQQKDEAESNLIKEVSNEDEQNQDYKEKDSVKDELQEELTNKLEKSPDPKQKDEVEIELQQEANEKHEKNNLNQVEVNSEEEVENDETRKIDNNEDTEENKTEKLGYKDQNSEGSGFTTIESQKCQVADTNETEKIVSIKEGDVELEKKEDSLKCKDVETKESIEDESNKQIKKDETSIKNQTISEIVNFLYNSRIRIDAQNVDQILETSQKCELDDIVAACERFKLAGTEIESTVSNVDLESPVVSQAKNQDPFIYEDPLFPLKMLDHFNDLRIKNLYCDCEINFRMGTETKPQVPNFNCHRVLLSALSPHFKTLLDENEEPILNDNEFPVGTLNKCLVFFYTGNIKVASTSVQKLIRAAYLVGSKELVDCCGEILETILNNENCIVFRQLAIENKSEALEVAANSWISQNFNSVTKTQVFKDLSVEVAEQILKSDEINLEFPSSDGEMVVFKACIRWLKENYESRKDFTERILSTVRYPLIDIQHLLSDISTEQFVIENDIISAHIANIMASKNSHIPIRSRMRGVPYVVTCGGSAIVEDVTSENQDYTPVGYYHKMTLYDTTLNKFHDWTSLPESRSLHCAVVVDQFLFIIGGYDPFSCISSEVHYLDMSSGKWNKGPEMKTKRVLFTAHLINNCIYVVGGLGARGYLSSVEKLDIATMTWHKHVSLPSTRYRHAGCVMSGEIYISGGNEKTSGCWSINCDKDTSWKERTFMCKGRDSHVMTSFNDNVIICAGGEGIEFSIERYQNEKWELLSINKEVCDISLLYYPSHVVFKDIIYFFGGWIGENEPTDQVWTFKPLTNEWKIETTKMPLALGSATSNVVVVPESYWKTKIVTTK